MVAWHAQGKDCARSPASEGALLAMHRRTVSAALRAAGRDRALDLLATTTC
jgi:hypothetical protein